jgi:hypothetical protein
MKKILIAFALCTAIAGHAQNAKKDASGNYVAISKIKDTTYTPTGKTYTDSKGVVYPVLITATGKVFVVRISKKTGKTYKQYLKVN